MTKHCKGCMYYAAGLRKVNGSKSPTNGVVFVVAQSTSDGASSTMQRKQRKRQSKWITLTKQN